MKKICHIIVILLICAILLSCNLDDKNWLYHYGDSIWEADKYEAYIYVESDGLTNQEFGTIKIDGIEKEVVYLFTPGALSICDYRGDDPKKELYRTSDEFCYGITTFERENKTFSFIVESSTENSIPVGTTIKFSYISDIVAVQ